MIDALLKVLLSSVRQLHGRPKSQLYEEALKNRCYRRNFTVSPDVYDWQQYHQNDIVLKTAVLSFCTFCTCRHVLNQFSQPRSKLQTENRIHKLII